MTARLGFSFASFAAVWVGYNLIWWRNWMAMAGSVAIMPGTCACCLAEFSIEAGSLVLPPKPEVSNSCR